MVPLSLFSCTIRWQLRSRSGKSDANNGADVLESVPFSPLLTAIGQCQQQRGTTHDLLWFVQMDTSDPRRRFGA